MKQLRVFLVAFLMIFPFAYQQQVFSVEIIKQTDLNSDQYFSHSKEFLPAATLENYYNYNSLYVPYYAQERPYSCGEAALRMLFAFWGLNVSEEIIGAVANWTESIGTYGPDLLRAAHFSLLSTAILNDSIKGYPDRKIGFPAFQARYLELDDLKKLIDQGFPVLVLTRYYYGAYGHFRVVKGYDDQQGRVIVHDPWYLQNPYGGANTIIPYNIFNELWDYSGHWGMIITPWIINYTITDLAPNSIFTITVNITYYVPEPFDPSDYPASSATLNITVPDGYTLLSDASIVFDDTFEGGESKTLEIQIQAPNTIGDNDTIILTAYGKINGSSNSYSKYEDYIGSIEKINLKDHMKPEIINIEHNSLYNPFKLNITVHFSDDSEVNVTVLYNIMNRNMPYQVINAILIDNIAMTNITFSSGNIDLEYVVHISDKYGNYVFSRSIIVHITDEPPQITLTKHEIYVKQQVDHVTLNWTIYDDFRIKFIRIYVNNKLQDTIYEQINEYNLTISEGIHKVVIIVYDNLFQSSNDSAIIYYDTQPPTIQANIDNGSLVMEYANLKFDVTDNVLLNKSILMIDNKKIIESNKSIDISIFLLPGSHNVKVYAVDMVGYETIKTIQITCLPVMTIIVVAVIALIVLWKKYR